MDEKTWDEMTPPERLDLAQRVAAGNPKALSYCSECGCRCAQCTNESPLNWPAAFVMATIVVAIAWIVVAIV